MSLSLEEEARRVARFREGARWTQLISSASAVMSWSQHHEVRLIAAALGGVLGSVITHISAKKWKERANWYATTQNWHEHLDQLPDVRSFPKLVDRVHEFSNNRKQLRKAIYVAIGLIVVEVVWIAWRALA